MEYFYTLGMYSDSSSIELPFNTFQSEALVKNLLKLYTNKIIDIHQEINYKPDFRIRLFIKKYKCIEGFFDISKYPPIDGCNLPYFSTYDLSDEEIDKNYDEIVKSIIEFKFNSVIEF